MPESPEANRRIAQMQKDIEELKEHMKDDWHDRRDNYENRVRKVMEKYPNCVKVWFAIDSMRSVKEIAEYLQVNGEKISDMTVHRCCRRLKNNGLIKKIGAKGKSSVFSKKNWAIALNLDDFVRQNFRE